MATTKLTVTVPDDVVRAARQAADGNLSAYVTKAIQDQLLRDAMKIYAEDSARLGDDFDDLYSAAEEDLCAS